MTLEIAIEAIRLARGLEAPETLVERVAFALPSGQSIGIVGESGSGKSLLALAIIGLLPPGISAAGKVVLDGRNLVGLPERELEHLRGARIGMIFQEPMTALNPMMRVGTQIAEGLIQHKGMTRSAARAEAQRWLDRVRIADAARRIDAYPHELSGGQRQRVGIAMALAPGPGLLLADEPTTALDVTVQAEILDLIAELLSDLHMSMILISHDLGVVAGITDWMLVMYAGVSVEHGPTERILLNPGHPYTRDLLAARPPLDASVGWGRERRLRTIPGHVPLPGQWPAGCRFVTRCRWAIAACGALDPSWEKVGQEHVVRCIRAKELA